MIRDKKEETEMDDAKLNKYREYEKIWMAEQRKQNKEEKRCAAKDGRKTGVKLKRRQKDKMRSKEIKKFKVQVAKQALA